MNSLSLFDVDTKKLIRNAGWALKDANGISTEEWTGIISLGSLIGGTQVYYQQSGSGTAASASTVMSRSDAVNEAVLVYESGTFDYRNYFKIFAREQGDVYAYSQLSDIGATSLTYQAYRFPLATNADPKVTVDDSTASLYDIGITYYTSSQQRDIGGTNRDFHVIIDGKNKTAEEIYTGVQYQLRQNVDIDSGSTIHIGKTTTSILKFVGDTLYTILQSEGGAFIDNYQSADINRLIFVDDTGSERTFPFTSVLTLSFGDNLVNDSSAKYWIYFTNDDAGNNTGQDYGTANAIIAQDANSANMTNNIAASSSVQLSYNYDTNIQRGTDSSGSDAPITAVAIGLSTAQFVKAAGTIGRSISNAVSLVAPLERNYSNP